MTAVVYVFAALGALWTATMVLFGLVVTVGWIRAGRRMDDPQWGCDGCQDEADEIEALTRCGAGREPPHRFSAAAVRPRCLRACGGWLADRQRLPRNDSGAFTPEQERGTAMSTLDKIADRGNRRVGENRDNWITCRDGFQLSVIAGVGAYCIPRPQLLDAPLVDGALPGDYSGPYTHVEVGYPSADPEPREKWDDYRSDGIVWSFVPVQLVRELIELHGGEA